MYFEYSLRSQRNRFFGKKAQNYESVQKDDDDDIDNDDDDYGDDKDTYDDI